MKLDVVLAQDGRCPVCGERLGGVDEIEFDHVPALQLRGWDDEAQDTVPGSNDPGAIQAKHTDCHARKTTGRKGDSKLSRVGGDISEIAKLRRITKDTADFQRRLLTKSSGDLKTSSQVKIKKAWPKRKFPSKRS